MKETNNNRTKDEEARERSLGTDGKQLHDPLTYEIIGAAQKVHRTLGPGFAESTYQAALAKELRLREIPFQQQQEFEVFYEGTLCGTYRPDMLVADKVVVELKAISELGSEHRAQTISYLKASGHRLGLLLNFGSTSLQVRRLRN
jgi:GxxExxY protein